MSAINVIVMLALALIGSWQLHMTTMVTKPLSTEQWWHLPLLVAMGIAAYYLLRSLTLAHSNAKHWQRKILGFIVPLLFAIWCAYIWEVVVKGFNIPTVLIPVPTQIIFALWNNLQILHQDFIQTFVRAVIPGYVLGCSAGFLIATIAWRFPLLRRGLVPLGNFMSVMPIVGIAPIMVMWFGFDWQSKAAVVIIMTFFPMFINTMSGLSEATKREQDLIRTYAASRLQLLVNLLLPRALPFIFNGLKICSTLALIGAIVAEFFGTPIVGMGFRISSETGRMNMDLVWATIVMSAIVGSTFYGFLALTERVTTFWHPSFHTDNRNNMF